MNIEVADGDADRIAENLVRELKHALGLRLRVTPVPAGQFPRYELKARRFRDCRKEGR